MQEALYTGIAAETSLTLPVHVVHVIERNNIAEGEGRSLLVGQDHVHAELVPQNRLMSHSSYLCVRVSVLRNISDCERLTFILMYHAL
jgi:hypothetical protein